MSYRDWFRANRTWLSVHTPNFHEFMRNLRTKGLLGEDEEAGIKANVGGTLQRETLYDHLVRFGEGRIQDIVACLRESNNEEEAKTFEEFSPDESVASTSKSAGPAPAPTRGVWFEVGELVYNFTGREQELANLHHKLEQAHLNSHSSLANVVCISGLGGIGKSTLARKYAFEFRDFYDGNVIWIHGRTLDSMRESFMRLAKLLLLKIGERATNKELASQIYKTVPPKCLFIFDNVEDNEPQPAFDQFRPRINHPDDPAPYVLVTSQRTDLVQVPENRLLLGVLTDEECIQLIQKKLPNASPEGCSRLSDRLQNFPLALQHAMHSIDEKHGEDDDAIMLYLNQLESSFQLLGQEAFGNLIQYEDTILNTWSVTVERIRGMDGGEEAVHLLNMLAYLNPDFISLEFVSALLETHAQPSLRLLERFSMIQTTGSARRTISIHRLVQHVVRVRLPVPDEENVLRTIQSAVQKQFEQDRMSDLARESKSHGLHLFQFQATRFEPLQVESEYLSDLSRYLLAYGNYDEARSISEQAADLLASINGEEHESTIRMRWRTADAYIALEDYPAATRILESILPICKTNLGSEHFMTANIMSSLGQAYLRTGMYLQAEQIFADVLTIFQSHYGDTHTNTHTATFNLATAQLEMGKLTEAMELYQHAYERRLELVEANDLRTLQTQVAIGRAHFREGDYGRALEVWEAAAEGYAFWYDETHPDAHIVKESIALAKSKLGRTD